MYSSAAGGADEDSEDDEAAADATGAGGFAQFGKQKKERTTAEQHALFSRKHKLSFGAIGGAAVRHDGATVVPDVPSFDAAAPPALGKRTLDHAAGSDDDDDSSDDGGGPQLPGAEEAGAEDSDAPDSDEAKIEYARSLGMPVSHEIALAGHHKVSCMWTALCVCACLLSSSYGVCVCCVQCVTAVATDRSGARLSTASNDYTVRLYDFAGMDRNHRAFKALTPKEDHVVLALSYSPTGDRLLVCTGSRQPMVFDRDGNQLAIGVKGDPYIMDMYHTNGHSGLVTGGQWHPTAANTVITCGVDGTVRVWDLLNPKLTFDKEMCNKQVIRVKNTGGTRLPVTACAYSPQGKHIIAGGEDGSLHYWNVRTVPAYPPNPDRCIRGAHADAITSITFRSGEGVPSTSLVCATRSLDHTIKLWDLANFKHPLGIITDVATLWPTTNLSFSPCGKYMVAGTAVKRAGVGKTAFRPKDASAAAATGDSGHHSDDEDEVAGLTSGQFGYLKLFDVDAVLASGAATLTDALYSVEVVAGDSVVSTNWHPITKQIICGCGDGMARVFYDPTITSKGALLSAARAPSRRGVGDFVMDFSSAIMNPDTRGVHEEGGPSKKRQRREEEAKRRAVLTKKPDLPDLAAQKKTGGSTFTQFLMQSKITAKNNIRGAATVAWGCGVCVAWAACHGGACCCGCRARPACGAVEVRGQGERCGLPHPSMRVCAVVTCLLACLLVRVFCAATGNWVSNAYAATQPQAQLAETTLEQDVEKEAAEKAKVAADTVYVEPQRRK